MNLQRLWCLLVIIAFSMPALAATQTQIDSFDDIAGTGWVESTGPSGSGAGYGSYMVQELVAEVNEGAGSMKFDFPSYVAGYYDEEVKRAFSPSLDWDSNWEDLAITLWVWVYDPNDTIHTSSNSPDGLKMNRLKEISLKDGSGRKGHFPAGTALALKDTGWNKVIAPLRNFKWVDAGDNPVHDPNVVDWNDIDEITLWLKTAHTSDHDAIYLDDMRLDYAPNEPARPYQVASMDDVNDELWDELRSGSNVIIFQGVGGANEVNEGTGSMMIDFVPSSQTVATPSLTFIPALDFTDSNDWAITIWYYTDLVGEPHLYHLVLHDAGDHLGRYRVPRPSTAGWNKVTARIDEFLWQDALELADMPTHTSDEVNLDAILWLEMWMRDVGCNDCKGAGNPMYFDDLRIEEAVEASSDANVYDVDKATITVDGSAADWAGLDSNIIDMDLTALPNQPRGDLHVQYRLAWDDDYLYILVEELTGDTETTEAADQDEFTADEMVSLYDGLSLWFDFTNNRQPEVEMHISFWLHLGLSSTGRTDLISAWTNAGWDKTPGGGHDPAVVANASVATSGTRPNRVIEAAVKWSDLDSTLDSWWQPVGGIEAAIQGGYIFGCDPRLQDRENENEATWNAAYGMGWFTGWAWDDRFVDDFMPTGRDAYSIDMKLVESGCATCMGDVDADTYVTTNDLAVLLNKLANASGNWYAVGPGDECEDMDTDTYITTNDLAVLLNQLANASGNWWECP